MHAVLLETIASQVPQIVAALAAMKRKRPAIYGAGEHTARLLKIWKAVGGPQLVCVLTTKNPRPGEQCYGLPVVGIENASLMSLDAVILSSHTYEEEFLDQAIRWLPTANIFPIYRPHAGRDHNVSWLAGQICNRFLPDERITIYDVGAFGISDALAAGQFWPGLPRKHLRVVAFEPDETECLRIRSCCEQAGIEIVTVSKALGARKGRAQLFVARNRSASSLYAPDLESLKRYRYVSDRLDRTHATERVETIELDTLDGVVAELDLPLPDFIKINAEGAELDIARAGETTLRQAMGVQIELQFAPKCVGGGLFADIDPVLREMNFELCDVLALNEVVRETRTLDFYHFRANRTFGGGPLGAFMGYAREKLEGHFLYFNRTAGQEPGGYPGAMRMLKMACLQETYGHPAAAIATLEHVEAVAPAELKTTLTELLADATSYFRTLGVDTNPSP